MQNVFHERHHVREHELRAKSAGETFLLASQKQILTDMCDSKFIKNENEN